VQIPKDETFDDAYASKNRTVYCVKKVNGVFINSEVYLAQITDNNVICKTECESLAIIIM
jgi:hypothetical protein